MSRIESFLLVAIAACFVTLSLTAKPITSSLSADGVEWCHEEQSPLPSWLTRLEYIESMANTKKGPTINTGCDFYASTDIIDCECEIVTASELYASLKSWHLLTSAFQLVGDCYISDRGAELHERDFPMFRR